MMAAVLLLSPHALVSRRCVLTASSSLPFIASTPVGAYGLPSARPARPVTGDVSLGDLLDADFAKVMAAKNSSSAKVAPGVASRRSSRDVRMSLCSEGVRSSRRAAVAAALATLASAAPACAFSNGIVGSSPKSRPAGPKPGDIGLKPNGSLRPCLDGKPHCFSSTLTVGDYAADTSKIGTDWLVPTWSYTGKSVAGALTDIKAAIDAYPPGRKGVDEGGFQIASVKFPEAADDAGYVYVQFESGGGYVDDVEFAVLNGVVHVRTSSRLGFLDFGVNAKRYNYFASKLGGVQGWKTTPLRERDHPIYFGQNDIADSDV